MAVAWIDADSGTEHEAGDHTIAVARVLASDAATELVDPLVFFRGAHGSFRGPQV